jgi:hypothetical protein
MTDPRIEAIRNHKLVGRGSCTTIDECFTDAELIREFDDPFWNVTSPEAAVEWALETEGIYREQALNCRWGEDTDPELKAHNDWKEKTK